MKKMAMAVAVAMTLAGPWMTQAQAADDVETGLCFSVWEGYCRIVDKISPSGKVSGTSVLERNIVACDKATCINMMKLMHPECTPGEYTCWPQK
jgi:hypothetical protein